jgi:hypothetical protein
MLSFTVNACQALTVGNPWPLDEKGAPILKE